VKWQWEEVINSVVLEVNSTETVQSENHHRPHIDLDTDLETTTEAVTEYQSPVTVNVLLDENMKNRQEYEVVTNSQNLINFSIEHVNRLSKAIQTNCSIILLVLVLSLFLF
jgi:preprotein translocase subunit SecB